MNIFDKYPYIVIEGPVGCGKSTLAGLLANQHRATIFNEQAERNPFLPKFYEDMKHYSLPTQLFFLFQRANQLDELKQKDFFRNGVVADFFLQKDPIFARLNLDDEEFKLYQQIYRH
ncbi:MAG: deoxynucleoside kinase, partial [Nitrosomonadales bacterium]|nr:deoxynucleoside kinase [Nitrosomonadales bacterium]